MILQILAMTQIYLITNNYILTQTNKDYLELTEKQYDYIELLLERAFLDWKIANNRELQGTLIK